MSQTRSWARIADPYLGGASKLVDFTGALRRRAAASRWVYRPAPSTTWYEVDMTGKSFQVVIHEGQNRIVVHDVEPRESSELELPLSLEGVSTEQR